MLDLFHYAVQAYSLFPIVCFISSLNIFSIVAFILGPTVPGLDIPVVHGPGPPRGYYVSYTFCFCICSCNSLFTSSIIDFALKIVLASILFKRSIHSAIFTTSESLLLFSKNFNLDILSPAFLKAFPMILFPFFVFFS